MAQLGSARSGQSDRGKAQRAAWHGDARPALCGNARHTSSPAQLGPAGL
jgi:hypothetical protein